jgi:hypothetical protein
LHQQGKRVPAIAEQLNLEGFTTPSRRTVFSTGTLAPIMQRLGLRGEQLGLHFFGVVCLSPCQLTTNGTFQYFDHTGGWGYLRGD